MPPKHTLTVDDVFKENTSREQLTTSVLIRLATPLAVKECLGFLGFSWGPAPAAGHESTADPVLYSWVAAGSIPDDGLVRCGAIYWGIGEGADGGIGRLNMESADMHSTPWMHGHGMGCQRLAARPVVGVVTRDAAILSNEGGDLDWMQDHLAFKDAKRVGPAARAFQNALTWLQDDSRSATAQAEMLAIRIAMHLGDTGAPLQSRHASAWGVDDGYDIAAYAAARRAILAAAS